jgi:hypothetical protein
MYDTPDMGAAPMRNGSGARLQARPPAASPSPLQVMYGHEQRRRRRLLRIITLGVMVPVVLLIPAALIPTLDEVTLIAVIIALVGTLLALALNQAGRISTGGFALMAGLAGAVAWEIVAKAQVQHGVDLSDLRLYDFFVLPIIVSAVLIGRRGPLIFGAGAVLFTIASLVILRHTPELQTYWDGHYKDATLGSYYDVIAVPLAIQVLAATAAWLGADSVRRALLDASRADDLAAANDQIQAQARTLEAQGYRLQQGIAQLQAVHAAVARGQWEARANITEGELLPVALSLNLLLDRLSRLTREADQRGRIDAASHELAIALRRLRAGEPYDPPNYTGTPFDEVLVELSRLRAVPPPPPSSRVTRYDLSAGAAGSVAGPRAPAAPAARPEAPFSFEPPFAPPFEPTPPFDLPDFMKPAPAGVEAFAESAEPGRMSLPQVRMGMQAPPVEESPDTSPLSPLSLDGTDGRIPFMAAAAGRESQPTLPSEEWPDLAPVPEPTRGPASGALPLWLQEQVPDVAPTPRPANPSREARPLASGDLPPWLHDEGVEAQATTEPRRNDGTEEEQRETPNYLPPWLQNMQ